MTELVTGAEMQAIERDAIASGEVTGIGLMEIAGRGVVDAILRRWPQSSEGAHSVTVLCGPGNNGGDGYVIARLLRTRGWRVRVLGMGEAGAMPPDARANRGRWQTMGEVEPLTLARFREGPESELYVDAIFGTGLTRPPEGDLLDLLRHLAGRDGAQYVSRLVAVDAPSGLDLDTGSMLAGGKAEPSSATVPLCALTVTFEVPKVGHFLADGPACCGRITVVDLGLLKWRGVRRDALTGAPGGGGGGAHAARAADRPCADGGQCAGPGPPRAGLRQAGRAQVRPRPRTCRLGPGGAHRGGPSGGARGAEDGRRSGDPGLSVGRDAGKRRPADRHHAATLWTGRRTLPIC